MMKTNIEVKKNNQWMIVIIAIVVILVLIYLSTDPKAVLSLRGGV